MNIQEIEQEILHLQEQKSRDIKRAQDFFDMDVNILNIRSFINRLASKKRFKHVKSFEYLDTYITPALLTGFIVYSPVANNTYQSKAWTWICAEANFKDAINIEVSFSSQFIPSSCENDITLENIRREKYHRTDIRKLTSENPLEIILQDLAKMCAKFEVDTNMVIPETVSDSRMDYFLSLLEEEKTILLAKKKAKELEAQEWLPRQKIYQDSGDAIRELYRPVGQMILQHINSLLASPLLKEALGAEWKISGDNAIRESTVAGRAYGLSIPMGNGYGENQIVFVFDLIGDQISLYRRMNDQELTGAKPIAIERIEGSISKLDEFLENLDHALVEFCFQRLEAIRLEKSLPDIKFDDE